MVRANSYRVSPVRKDLFAFWQDEGYFKDKRAGKDVLVKQGEYETITNTKLAFVQRSGAWGNQLGLGA